LTHRNYDLSQDLTQKTFLKIFTFFNKYNITEKEHLNTWMIKVARNIWYDHLRRKKNVLQAEIEEDECDIKYYDKLVSETNIEEDYQIKELKVVIEEIVSLLPPNQRELFKVLQMHELDGLQYKEISKITGITNDSLRQSSSRIKKILRIKLSEALQN
jgi:RNA polymerase sigma-70 factor (ECF subfamily)